MLAPYLRDHEVEGVVGQAGVAGVGLDEGELGPELRLERARRVELRRSDVDAHRTRAEPREPRGDIRGAAAGPPPRPCRRRREARAPRLRARPRFPAASPRASRAASPRPCTRRSSGSRRPVPGRVRVQVRQARRGRTARAPASRSPASPSRARRSPGLERVVAADRPGGRVERVRRTHHGADDRDRRLALDRERERGARRDEGDRLLRRRTASCALRNAARRGSSRPSGTSRRECGTRAARTA